MHLDHLTIKGFRPFGDTFELPLTPGLNVLVGENDSGKSAVIDAIRLALGTTSQDFLRAEESDFHFAGGEFAPELTIRCKFAGIDEQTGGALATHLTYEDGSAFLYLTFKATLNQNMPQRLRIGFTHRSGKNGDGPVLDNQERRLLNATYLRPLRD